MTEREALTGRLRAARELAARGATPGEREAARAAVARLEARISTLPPEPEPIVTAHPADCPCWRCAPLDQFTFADATPANPFDAGEGAVGGAWPPAGF